MGNSMRPPVIARLASSTAEHLFQVTGGNPLMMHGEVSLRCRWMAWHMDNLHVMQPAKECAFNAAAEKGRQRQQFPRPHLRGDSFVRQAGPPHQPICFWLYAKTVGYQVIHECA